MTPAIAYAKSGETNIAYSVVGDGPDLVLVSGWVSNVGLIWENPITAKYLRRLSGFSRLIQFDKRGTGMSDRNVSVPTLEERMDDVRAVMDAVGSERAAVFGTSEGGSLAMLFAATYPERTRALALWGSFAARRWSADYPWAPTDDQRQDFYDVIERQWGDEMDIGAIAPTIADDETQKRLWSNYFRMSASPSAALALARLNTDIDVRHVLPAIRIPTLVMHNTGDQDVSVEEGRWIASQIPCARFVEFPGDDHMLFVGGADPILDELQEFLTGSRPVHETARVLATVVFTDIVESTAQAARAGDRAWLDVLESHNRAVLKLVEEHSGRLVKNTGDGALAVFDGPARAVRCAQAIGREAQSIGVAVRAGVHCGEIELMGSDVGGIAVHIAARVMSAAAANEVLVSRTVRDLTSGSGLTWRDLGEREFRGVPDRWHVYAADPAP